MSESSSYAIARDLLRDEPDLHAFLVAIFQFGVAPPPASGAFSGSALVDRVQRRDYWAGQQPRRLAKLGLLRGVQLSTDGACYVVVDPAGICRALRERGLDPFQRLPGDFFNEVAKIETLRQGHDENSSASIVWVEQGESSPFVDRRMMIETKRWSGRIVAILLAVGFSLSRVADRISRAIGVS
jgi:hypothetical protein